MNTCMAVKGNRILRFGTLSTEDVTERAVEIVLEDFRAR